MNEHINIHIEEMVLHGFAPGDAEGIRLAVSQELTRLLAMQGLPSAVLPQQHSRGIHRLATPDVLIHHHANAGAIGTGIAGSVYNGLNGAGKNNRVPGKV